MTKKHSFLVIGTLLLGLIFVVVMVKLKQGPAHEGTKPIAQSVRVVEITPMPFRLHAQGFGNVSPGESWQAVASVGGRVTWRHPDLESGNLMAEGTRLLEIDPTRYELAIRAAQADMVATRTELGQLDQEAENVRKLLALEHKRLSLAERELERVRTLADKAAISETQVDVQEKATLQQRQAVQSLNNQLSLMPSKKDALKARLARTEAALEQAQKDLEDTRFVAPFDLRLHRTQVALHQQVSPGQTLFIADSIATAEALIQIPVPDLRRLLQALASDGQPVPETGGLPDLNKNLELHKLHADLSLAANPTVRWPATVSRIASGLDPSTRTVQVALTVEEPYRNASPPEQPPLVRDMYVKGTLALTLPEPVMVIPASAVHQGHVYLVTETQRLERRPVTVAWTQRDLSVTNRGLSIGDLVVLDDLVPAIAGMPLQPVPNMQALESLRQQARGDQL